MIKPTVGRSLHYRKAENDTITSVPGEPLACILAGVCSDTHVNLGVFDSNGNLHSRTAVPLIQEGEAAPVSGHYAEWMPYQNQQVKEKTLTPAEAVKATSFSKKL